MEANLVSGKNGWFKFLHVEGRYNNVCECLVKFDLIKKFSYFISQMFSVVFWTLNKVKK